MKNQEYWRKRFIQLEKASNNYGLDAYSRIEPAFNQAMQEIEHEINTWYARFAHNNQVSMADARKLLTGDQLKELKWDVNEYIKYGKDNDLGIWTHELENASAKFHISRLEALKIRTQHAAEKAFGNEIDVIDEMCKDVYTNNYYHSLFEIEKGVGIGKNIGTINTKKLDKLVKKPWAVDDKNFDKRIWESKSKLINELHNELTKNCILGKGPDEAIENIAKKMNVSKKQAGRLVMTEEAYFHSVSQKDAFDELDVEEFEIVATLDSHTSTICQEMDGKHYPMKDYEAGVTAPPFHPWCRSVTAPYFDDEFSIGERVARDEDGKRYYVPSDMNYDTWYDKFVNGGDMSDLEEIEENGILHYSKIKKDKKVYLTKKKLQSYIQAADDELIKLDDEFLKTSQLTYDELIKNFNSIDGLSIAIDPNKEFEYKKLKYLESQILEVRAQKAEWVDKLNTKLIQEKKKELSKNLKELTAEKIALEEQLNNFEIKTYSGIWKNDVTTEDYPHLNITGKKDYFINKLVTNPDIKWIELSDQLDELEQEGIKLANLKSELKTVDDKLNKINKDLHTIKTKGIIEEIEDDAYTLERKNNALWTSDAKEADDKLRKKCGEIWSSLTDKEKDDIFTYTYSYHQFNEPLRGIEYGTNNYIGVGKLNLDDIGVKYSGNKKGQVREMINNVTDIIEQSTYDFDMWIQRGADYMGVDKFFEIPVDTLRYGTQDELDSLLLGKTITEHGFCSCGVAKGKGFKSKNIIMNIYAPKGTKMMYAEPFSDFGLGDKRAWDGKSKQSFYGSEAEIILQQGTKFRITKIKKDKMKGKLYIDLEVIEQIPQL